MPITELQAMVILKDSPNAAAHWAQTKLPKWTAEPFENDSFPLTAAYAAANTTKYAGRTFVADVGAVTRAAKRWAEANIDNDIVAEDARAILKGEERETFSPRAIDEIVQTAVLGSVTYK